MGTPFVPITKPPVPEGPCIQSPTLAATFDATLVFAWRSPSMPTPPVGGLTGAVPFGSAGHAAASVKLISACTVPFPSQQLAVSKKVLPSPSRGSTYHSAAKLPPASVITFPGKWPLGSQLSSSSSGTCTTCKVTFVLAGNPEPVIFTVPPGWYSF